MQPIVVTKGVARFKANHIVGWMLDQLDALGLDLNMIALTFGRIHRDDYQQLMQLIGYSVDGYGGLPGRDPDVLRAADAEVEKLIKRKP